MPAELDLDAYRAFDSGAGAGIPAESDWEALFRHLLLPGVAAGEPFGTTPHTTEFQVYADSSGRQVKVRLGRALLYGHPGWTTAEKTLALDTADATNPRIDLVVLRLDRVANKVILAAKTGTPAATPAAPGLTQTDLGVFEIPLGEVDVAAGATTIAAAAVRDRRQWAIPDTRGLPTIRATRTTDQAAVASGADTAVVFGLLTYQTGPWFRTAEPTKLYLPRRGLYRVTGRVRWQANASGFRQVGVRLNGTTFVALQLGPALNGAENVVEASGHVLSTASGDYIELMALQTSGSALSLELRSYAPVLEAEFLRATT